MTKPLYQHLAAMVDAIANCERSGNIEWRERHLARLATAVEDFLPSGSGFDSGTTIDRDRSTGERLVFSTAFHHMDNGFYVGWSHHDVVVTPSLIHGFTCRVTGRNRRDIKEYIGESFDIALQTLVTWSTDSIESPAVLECAS